MMMPNAKKAAQAGFSIFEMMVVLLVISALIYELTPAIGRARTYLTMRLMAWQMGQVERGLQAYVAPNEAAVEAATSNGTTTAVITVATLQAGGYLWSGFTNEALNGGSYVGIARRIAAGQLETLVIATGGKPLTDSACGLLAKLLGGDGGCVSAHSPTQVTGSGGWTALISNFPGNPYSMPVGTPAVGTYFSGANIVSPYLDRYPVGGQTEPQTMHAPINMNGNAVNNASTMTANTEMYSPLFGDLTNPGTYYVQPAGTSMINRLIAAGRASTSGLSPDDIPGGWGGGFRTFDITASGTVGAGYNTGSGSLMPSYLNSSGFYTTGLVQASGTGTFGGAVYASVVYQTSDRREKFDIKPIEDPWMLLTPVVGERYRLKGTGETKLGVLAQDVEKTMPELVSESPDADHHKTLNYEGLMGPVIAAMQQDHEELVALKAEMGKKQIISLNFFGLHISLSH